MHMHDSGRELQCPKTMISQGKHNPKSVAANGSMSWGFFFSTQGTKRGYSAPSPNLGGLPSSHTHNNIRLNRFQMQCIPGWYSSFFLAC